MQFLNRLLLLSARVLRTSRLQALLLAILLLSSHTVLAANWVYMDRHEGTRYGACTEYIDADSVFKDDKSVTYWTIWVFDEKNSHHNIMKILHKKEAALIDPPMHRIMERYYFNAANEEIRRYLEPMKDYGNSADEISRALGYAKAKSQDSEPKPDHVLTPTPRWYRGILSDDCDLYWDIHSIVAWPQDKPTAVDIRVKKMWNPTAIDRRKAFLSTLHPGYQQDYDGLRYTIVNYQFLISYPQVRVLEETDFDRDNQRITVVDGTAWKAIVPGSVDDAARSIALKWIKDKDESSGKF